MLYNKNKYFCSCITWAIELSEWCFSLLSFSSLVCGRRCAPCSAIPPWSCLTDRSCHQLFELQLLWLTAGQDVRGWEPLLSDGSRGHRLPPGVNPVHLVLAFTTWQPFNLPVDIFGCVHALLSYNYLRNCWITWLRLMFIWSYQGCDYSSLMWWL